MLILLLNLLHCLRRLLRRILLLRRHLDDLQRHTINSARYPLLLLDVVCCLPLFEAHAATECYDAPV